MRTQTVYRSLMTLSFVGLLSACGGGGGGGGGDDAPAAVTSAGTVSAGVSRGDTVTGGVTKGPVNGATVLFYPVDQFGFPLATEIASARTNAAGNFTVTLPAGAGTVLVESFGGSFIDEADRAGNRVIQLGPNEGFSSILPNGSARVAINPITDSLVLRSRELAAPEGGFGGIFNTSRATFASEAGFDAFTTVPANPTSPAAGASLAEKQYALLLGGLANVINVITVELGLAEPTYEVIKAVIFDLVDGELNGLKYGEPVRVQGANGVQNLATDIDFIKQLNRFKNNNAAAYTGTAAPTFDFSILANRVPTANAGVDRTVASGELVTLDGSASSDPEGGLSYSWVQTAGPTVSLTRATTATPTFTAPNIFDGSGVLAFTLTVTDAANATATDAVNMNVTRFALPRKFAVVDQDGYGGGIGENIDGGLVVTLNSDGSGTLFDDNGTVAIQYTLTSGNSIRINYPPGYVEQSFSQTVTDPSSGSDIVLQFEERPAFIDLTVVQDLANADVVEAHIEGQLVPSDARFTNILYTDDLVLTAYDFAKQIPFVVEDKSERMLKVNLSPQIAAAALNFDREKLHEDILVFNANGTGTADYSALSFLWVIQLDGHLRVTYSTGDIADYYHLAGGPTGDIMSTDMTLVTPLVAGDDNFINDLGLSFKRSASRPILTTANTPGVYTGLAGGFDNDQPLPFSLRLNPDGTGLVEFQQNNPNGPAWVRSSFGLCWNIDADNVLVTRRGFARDLYFAGSRGSTPAFCSGLVASEDPAEEHPVVFKRDLELFSIFGNQYRFHDRRLTTPVNCLGSLLDPGCVTGPLLLESSAPRVMNKEILTAVPPLTADYFIESTDGNAVTVNVLANSLARELAIDPATVEIITLPNMGSATVTAPGEITFVPGANTSEERIQYRLSDTAGNRSSVGNIDIVVGPPVAVATAPSVAIPGQTVTLDASSSTDNGSIVSYTWQQFGGETVVLDDPTSVSPSFTVPPAPLVEFDAQPLQFQLQIEDNTGLTSNTAIFISVQPVLPSNFFALTEFDPAFQFGRDIDSGARVNLLSNFTGQLIGKNGASPLFTYFTSGSTLTLDFNVEGELISSVTSFEDTDGDTFQEQIIRSQVISRFEYTVVNDTAGIDIVDVRVIGQLDEENVDLDPGVIVSSSLDKTVQQTVFDLAIQTPFNIVDGETRSLISNMSTALFDLKRPENIDELTFVLDPGLPYVGGGGSARFNTDTFQWSIEPDGHLQVVFDSTGDIWNHYLLISKDSGDVVVSLQDSPGNITAHSELSFKDDPAIDWELSAFPSVAGVYESAGRVELNDGSFVNQTLNYRINADGTGVLETPTFDPITGQLDGWFSSGLSICWAVNSVNDFVWIRTSRFGLPTPPRFDGDNIPDPADCGVFDFDALTTPVSASAVNFRRDHKLFDFNVNGTLRTTARNIKNFAGDGTLSVESFFPRLFDFTPFNGVPWVAARDPENIVLEQATEVLFVTMNDIPGSAGAASIEIIVGPKLGVATVSGLNIEYTADFGAFDAGPFDTIYYRVIDVNGNKSTIGVVEIEVFFGG